jgi:hypothetical protein
VNAAEHIRQAEACLRGDYESPEMAQAHAMLAMAKQGQRPDLSTVDAVRRIVQGVLTRADAVPGPIGMTDTTDEIVAALYDARLLAVGSDRP